MVSGKFRITLTKSQIFNTILNFKVSNWAGQHNCTKTLRKAAITTSDSAHIQAAWDRELY